MDTEGRAVIATGLARPTCESAMGCMSSNWPDVHGLGPRAARCKAPDSGARSDGSHG